MDNSNKKYKIFCFTVPASGHNIPLYPIINELNKNYKNVEVVAYTLNNFKEQFENVGAQFRNLNFDANKILITDPVEDKKRFPGFILYKRIIDLASENIDYIAREINKGKPDLIVYDATLAGKYFNWAAEYYQKRYSEKTITDYTHKLPPMVAFSPSFASDMEVYPNTVELSSALKPSQLMKFSVMWHFILYLYAHFKICLKFRLGFLNPFKKLAPEMAPNTKLYIASVFPELQPRSHLFDTQIFKFIGCTVDDKVNDKNYSSMMNEAQIAAILKSFEAVDNKINILDEKTDKLVYMSFGTMFNYNLDLYKTIFNAFKTFDLEPEKSRSKIKQKSLKVLVSTGEKTFNIFQDLINKKEYELPDNIILAKSTPQTEILKRACLHITHCGMNSTSESIHYSGDYKIIFT